MEYKETLVERWKREAEARIQERLDDREDDPMEPLTDGWGREGEVWIYYYGRWWPARVDRIAYTRIRAPAGGRKTSGGRGAWVLFRTTKEEKRRYVTPIDSAARLDRRRADLVADALGLGWPDLDALVEAATREEVTLDDPRFEVQALANTIDRLAGGYVVDRGKEPVPDDPLW